jgi:cytochrome c556
MRTIVLLMLLLLFSLTWAAAAPAPAKRAKPPTFDPAEVEKVFPSDPFAELVGKRPEEGVASSVSPGATNTDNGEGGDKVAGGKNWSALISAEALEDEIKSVQRDIAKTLTTPVKFKGGGNKLARKQFSELAVLFAIVAEYDGDVRWKKQAPGLRDSFARAGYNCKVGTDGAYKEAKARATELADMVRGENPKVSDAERLAKWDKVSGRPPLMQRMEDAQQRGVAIFTANASEFSRNGEKLVHEAMLLSALALTIQQPGYEFADDITYLGYARELQASALAVITAVKSKNYEAARAAAGKMSKACSDCHDGYRSG